MRVQFKQILLVFIVTIFCSSCAKSSPDLSSQPAPESNDQPAPVQVHPQEEKPEDFQLASGDNISKNLTAITIQDLSKKEIQFSKLLGSDKTIIAVVKPGCVFCESMLAIANSTKMKTKAKLIIVMDAKHAEFKQFKEKSSKYSKLKASWVYDINNSFHDQLNLNSFPRLVVIDKNAQVLEHQVGLVMPENKEELASKEFPEVLQILSINTVNWLQSL